MLDAKSDLTFHEILPLNFVLQGAFTLAESDESGLNIFVLGPRNEIIYTRRRQISGSFKI